MMEATRHPDQSKCPTARVALGKGLARFLTRCLAWRPGIARRREERLTRHRDLSQAFQAHMEAAKAYEKRAKKAAVVDWAVWDTPWVDLLEAWLADPEPAAGLKDLLFHYAIAWQTSHGLRNRPAQTPMGEWVQKQWENQVWPPVEAMQMALESNVGFSYAMWTWALHQSSGAGIPLALASLRARDQSCRWQVTAFAIAKVSPRVNAALFEALWGALTTTEQAALLSIWVCLPDIPSEQWLTHAARVPTTLHTNCLKAWVPDAWHQGLLDTVEVGMEGRLALSQVVLNLGRWSQYWPGSHEGCLKQELRHLWDRSVWFNASPLHEQRLGERLDQLTQALAPMVPVSWWTDPDFWGARPLLPMTWAAARQTHAVQTPPNASPRARRRS